MAAMTTDLNTTLNSLWADLTRGAADKKSPLNRPAIATATVSGQPACRTVVLRKVTPSERTLVFHTDIRSAKVAELERTPTVAWLFWNPRANIQIRVTAETSLHHNDDVARAAWASLHDGSRRTYAQITSPSAVVEAPGGSDPAILSLDVAEDNFVVVQTTATAIDWLNLAPTGHRRAQWVWNVRTGKWDGRWVGA